MEPSELKQLLQQGLPDAQIQVDGDGRHFDLVIISSEFIGKSKVQQQQRVYQIVNAAIADGSLHALSMKTYTPEQWATINQNQ